MAPQNKPSARSQRRCRSARKHPDRRECAPLRSEDRSHRAQERRVVELVPSMHRAPTRGVIAASQPELPVWVCLCRSVAAGDAISTARRLAIRFGITGESVFTYNPLRFLTLEKMWGAVLSTVTTTPAPVSQALPAESVLAVRRFIGNSTGIRSSSSGTAFTSRMKQRCPVRAGR